MKHDTHHIGTDLDLESLHDLTPLTDALAQLGLIVGHVNRWENGLWTARLTPEEWFEEADQSIASTLTAIEKLDESSGKLWAACTLRQFDIGYESGEEPQQFIQILTAATLSRIAAANASIMITIYPEWPDPGPLYFTATSKFNPDIQRTYNGHNLDWQSYIDWSGLTHVKEIITLDGILGERVVERDNELDVDFLVWEDFSPLLYTDKGYLLSKLEGQDPLSYNLLAVTKEPTEPCEKIHVGGFEFIGYDLMDVEGGNSALTNCGGFDNTFLPQELNEYGLLSTYQKAYKIKEDLLKNNPNEPHAQCYVWAIWRIK